MINDKRLTLKDGSGNWQLRGIRWRDLHAGAMITKEIGEKLYGALWKLMRYEDTGLSPEEMEQFSENNVFKYPIGSKVIMDYDDSEDEPHEVIGYKSVGDSDYLIFKDGSTALIEKVAEVIMRKGAK